jgi:hypothetical protein
MSHRISRRTLLTAAAATAPLLISDALDPLYPVFRRGAPATPAAAATTSTATSSGAYGPDGTHWPANTPTLDATFGRVIDVACDWAAIGKAIAAVSDAEIGRGVHIRVAPGQLPGFGASSGSQAVLKNVGRGTAAKNILVSPKNGWGSVTIVDSARITNVKGVTFARINARTVLLTDCSRTSWAHSKVSHGFRMTSSNGVTTECNAYEVVMADAKVDINDPMGFAAGTNSMITDSVWDGCYIAPVYRPSGATDHIDALQMYGNGAYRGLTIRDTTIFGGINSALQLGGPKSQDPDLGTPFATIEHSILAAQIFAIRVRYPLPDGAYEPKMGQAINGAGEAGQLFARDSYVFGSLYTTKWGEVTNSFTSYSKATTTNTSDVGGWQYDAGMASLGAAWFDERTPEPTDAYLAGIWG